MKASEVIAAIQGLIAEHGDLETHASAAECRGPVLTAECIGGPGYAHIKEKIFDLCAGDLY